MTGHQKPIFQLVSLMFFLVASFQVDAFTGESSLGAIRQSQIFGSVYWETDSVNEQVVSAQMDDVDKNGQYEMCYIEKDRLVVGRISGESVQLIAQEKSGRSASWQRVFLSDFDHDGTTEILVTGFLNDRVLSQIFALEQNKLKLEHEFNELVVSFMIDGQSVLYGQKFFGPGRWATVIHPLVWNGKIWSEGNPVTIQRGLSENSISLLSVAFHKGSWVVMNNDRKLSLQDNLGKKLWKGVVSYGSGVSVMPIRAQGVLGGVSETNQIIPLRMVSDDARFLVLTSDDTLKAVVGTTPNVQSSRLVMFDALNASALRELKQFPAWSVAVTDMQLVDFNRDGVQDLFISFWVPQNGVLEFGGVHRSGFAVMPVVN